MNARRSLLRVALVSLTLAGCAGNAGGMDPDGSDPDVRGPARDARADGAREDATSEEDAQAPGEDANPGEDAPAPDGTEPLDGTEPDATEPPDVTVPEDGEPPPEDVPVAPDGVNPMGPAAVLEIHALDLWAQPLPASERTLTVRRGGTDVPTRDGEQDWVQTVELTAAGAYAVSLSAPEHRAITVNVSFDGTASLTGLSSSAAPAGTGLVLQHTVRTVAGRGVTVHSLYLGLRHLWFSAQGRPARRGNSLRFLMDGEEAWGAVNTDLRAARTSIHAATWWWESNFELVRDARLHPTQTVAQRRPNTVLAVMEASRARKRILVGQFLTMDGAASTLSSDAELRAHGTMPGDNFEYMGQANPSRGMFRWEIPSFRFGDRVKSEVPGASDARFDSESLIASEVAPRSVDLTELPFMADVLHASYHQKFMVLDDRVAFIGGMNLRRVDWDTSQHLVFEPRRMEFESTAADRAAVVAHDEQPDMGPRKDYMVRIEGPIVRDASDVFARRWNYLRETRARYYDDATDITVPSVPAPVAGGVTAQVTATLPEPFREYAIAETWFNAVAQAREYIYIEDQYFRIPMLTDAIMRRMDAVPGLRLIVITKPINEWSDPGCAWTYRTHGQFSTRYRGRYQLLQLRSFGTSIASFGIDETDAHFVDMDTHAKILIVDDVFLSVGSCNKNNRGVVYEGELNIAVHDGTWVRAARRRILANLLGVTDPGSDDAATWYAAVARAAAANDAVRARWDAEGDDLNLNGAAIPTAYRPVGFLYTMTFGPVDDCLLESIGPDVV